MVCLYDCLKEVTSQTVFIVDLYLYTYTHPESGDSSEESDSENDEKPVLGKRKKTEASETPAKKIRNGDEDVEEESK